MNKRMKEWRGERKGQRGRKERGGKQKKEGRKKEGNKGGGGSEGIERKNISRKLNNSLYLRQKKKRQVVRGLLVTFDRAAETLVPFSGLKLLRGAAWGFTSFSSHLCVCETICSTDTQHKPVSVRARSSLGTFEI